MDDLFTFVFRFVFRLHSADGSEFLFGAETEEQQAEWVKKIKFHAGLPPAQQLTSYKVNTAFSLISQI